MGKHEKYKNEDCKVIYFAGLSLKSLRAVHTYSSGIKVGISQFMGNENFRQYEIFGCLESGYYYTPIVQQSSDACKNKKYSNKHSVFLAREWCGH